MFMKYHSTEGKTQPGSTGAESLREMELATTPLNATDNLIPKDVDSH
jgi:hypothetical protein